MSNRPPSPFEVIDIDEKNELWFANGSETFRIDYRQQNAMQEALTAEWLISIGAMPDPSEFVHLGNNEWYPKWQLLLGDWDYCYEDKDPHGKPHHYALCANAKCSGKCLYCKKVQR